MENVRLKRAWGGVVVGAVLCVAMLPAAARAQDAQQPTATLQVYTRLVVLDVVVVDKKGVPQLDLKKEDFKLLEGKDEQKIRTFEPPSLHVMPKGVVVKSSADLGKIGSAPVNIIVLDELNTPFEDNAYTRFSAQKFLKAQPEVMPPTTLLVANNPSFKMLQDYTQDRSVLEAALKRDPAEYPWRLARNGNNGPDAVVRFGQTLDILQQIAQAAAGTPGRKNIIWIGKGFPSIDLTQADSGVTQPVADAIKRCTDLLMSSRVTLYVVDPTPLSSATYDIIDTPTTLADIKDETGEEPFANAVSFNPLAKTTGGRVFDSRNDVNNEIAESVREGMNYYTITYRPATQPDADDAYRHVHVLLNRPGLIAMTRDGYYVQPAVDPAAKADPKEAKKEQNLQVLDVASAALSKMVYNGVKVRAGKASAGAYNLAVGDASLTWTAMDDGTSSAQVEVVAVYFDAKGKVLSHAAVEKKISAKAPNAKAGEEEIVSVPMSAPAGTVRVRFVVRDAGSGRLGSADLATP